MSEEECLVPILLPVFFMFQELFFKSLLMNRFLNKCSALISNRININRITLINRVVDNFSEHKRVLRLKNLRTTALGGSQAF